MPSLTPTVLLLLICAALVGHVALLILAYRIHPLWILAAAFLVTERFAQAIDIPMMYTLKYVRVYVTVLMFLLGLLIYRLVRIGAAGWAFLVFVTIFTLGALWSDYPLLGLQYKGLYWLLAAGGLMVAASVRNSDDARTATRVLFVGLAMFLVLVLIAVIQTPSQLLATSRLRVYGINANGLGEAGAMLIAMSLYLYYADPSKLMRLVALAASIAGGVVVLYSGSRGAAGQALIAAVILLLPQAKRPWLLLILAVVVGGAVMTLQSVLASEAAQRLTDVSFDTREDIWALAWSIIQEKPLIGHGWLSTILEDGRRSTFNLHSIYLQVIGEIGFLGFLVMMGCLAYIAARTIKAYVYTRHLPQERSLWYLATAVMLSLLARGVVEIGAITGSHSAAMMLAWGIGMVEVVIALAQQRHYAQAWWSAQAASMGQPLAAV